MNNISNHYRPILEKRVTFHQDVEHSGFHDGKEESQEKIFTGRLYIGKNNSEYILMKFASVSKNPYFQIFTKVFKTSIGTPNEYTIEVPVPGVVFLPNEALYSKADVTGAGEKSWGSFKELPPSAGLNLSDFCNLI